MSNSYFQFKQFRIEQQGAAMKVSTDACIQGAWTPVERHVRSVIDIGTGTGLLSLMLAQRNNEVEISAIEVNADAANCAKENIANSKWIERMSVIQTDATQHHYDKKFDLLICNPPFFQNSLQSNDDGRKIARHNTSLDYKSLVELMEKVISKDGYASILLPIKEHAIWEQLLLKYGWFVYKKLLVRPRVDLPINRVVSLCARKSDNAIPQEEEALLIYENVGEYSNSFLQLMRPFYLNL